MKGRRWPKSWQCTLEEVGRATTPAIDSAGRLPAVRRGDQELSCSAAADQVHAGPYAAASSWRNRSDRRPLAADCWLEAHNPIGGPVFGASTCDNAPPTRCGLPPAKCISELYSAGQRYPSEPGNRDREYGLVDCAVGPWAVRFRVLVPNNAVRRDGRGKSIESDHRCTVAGNPLRVVFCGHSAPMRQIKGYFDQTWIRYFERTIQHTYHASRYSVDAQKANIAGNVRASVGTITPVLSSKLSPP